MTTHVFEIPQQRPWDSPFPDQPPTSAGHSSPGDGSHAYWGRHADSPMTPGFSPHMSGPISSMRSSYDARSSSGARSSFTSFAPSRSDSAWTMPTRSMSFGHVEDLPMSYQNHYHHPNPIPSMDYRRRASEMHPPSLATSNNSSTASISESHMTPLPALSSTPPVQQHWGIPSIPTTWSTLPSSSFVTKAPEFGGWYGEPGPLAKVQEEELGPHLGVEPAIVHSVTEYQ